MISLKIWKLSGELPGKKGFILIFMPRGIKAIFMFNWAEEEIILLIYVKMPTILILMARLYSHIHAQRYLSYFHVQLCWAGNLSCSYMLKCQQFSCSCQGFILIFMPSNIKAIFMFNSAEQEIYPAHKC